MSIITGSDFRLIESVEHNGKPALVAVAARTYDTSVADLWNAITTPDRLARWFAPVDGDLQQGGRFQIQGNASGTIVRCDPPQAIDLTWEFGGDISWVYIQVTPDGSQARLTLRHVMVKGGAGEHHMKQYGPGAVGIGWDLALLGLERFVDAPDNGGSSLVPDEWYQSDVGQAFIRASGQAWGAAHAASGLDSEDALAQAERTIAFYLGV